MRKDSLHRRARGRRSGTRRGHGGDERQPRLQDEPGRDDRPRRRRARPTRRSSRSATRSGTATCSSRSRTGSRSRRTARARSTSTSTTRRRPSRSRTRSTGDGHRIRLQRLHELARQQAAAAPEVRRRAQRLVRDQLGPELPALLLELPRHRGARLRPAAAAHERGGHRLGEPERHRVAGRRSARRRPGRSATVVAIDEQNGKVKPIWGMGRHNHENSVADPGLRQAGRALG